MPGPYPAVNGVQIRLHVGSPPGGDIDTFRIKTLINPDSPFYDSYRRIRIEVFGKSAVGARVRVSYNADPNGPLVDSTTPTVPSGLVATTVSSSQIDVSWKASIDEFGVSGYRVFRNGILLTTTPATTLSNTQLNSGTEYSCTVSAFDAAGNTSIQSAAAIAKTFTSSTSSPSPSPTPDPSPNPSGLPSPIPTPSTSPSPSPSSIPSPSPTPIGEPDTILPTVTITSPLNGTTVPRRSKVTIRASAIDASGVTKLSFYRNGSLLVCASTDSPAFCSFTAAEILRTKEILWVKAYDPTGNVGISPKVTVSVKRRCSR